MLRRPTRHWQWCLCPSLETFHNPNPIQSSNRLTLGKRPHGIGDPLRGTILQYLLIYMGCVANIEAISVCATFVGLNIQLLDESQILRMLQSKSS